MLGRRGGQRHIWIIALIYIATLIYILRNVIPINSLIIVLKVNLKLKTWKSKGSPYISGSL